MRRADAASLMQPLRVVLGVSMPLTDAVRRFAMHEAESAPVVRSDDAVGIMTRSAAEHATRMGAGAIPVGEILCGGAPRVNRRAGPSLMKTRAQGVAPGLIVSGPGRIVCGLIPRHRIHEIQGQTGLDGPNLRSRMERSLGESTVDLLRSAGAIAVERGVALHLAGGVVRDLLMGRSSRDLDLVVEGDGLAFASRFCQQLGGTLASHERFGTAVIRLDSALADASGVTKIDVATARRETYEHPAALPRVEPGTIVEDIGRRDVTINSMMIRLDGRRFGNLVDEVGARRDLRRRALQVHHRMSLVDDPTRAFRIARFAARFGLTPTEDTRCSLRLARELGAFERLGGERLLRELVLIAAEPEPSSVWSRGEEYGLLAQIGAGLRWNRVTERQMTRLFHGIRTGALRTAPPPLEPALLMLMLLSRDTSRSQRVTLAERLRMTGRRAARLVEFVEQLDELTGRLSRRLTASRVAMSCQRAEPEILALAWTMGGAPARAVEWYLKTLRNVRPTLTGAALGEMGLRAGPEYADVLGRLRTAILDGRVRTPAGERALALRLVRRMRHKR